MNVTTVGLDLAKNVFQVHGVDAHGKAVLRKVLKREEMMRFFTQLQPCLIGIEACGSAHFWARQLVQLGHTVRLMALQFVKPYVKTNKNDARDAEAICEAVTRPNMRYVPIKTLEQQSLLALHRARQGFVSGPTAQANQIRGLLSEFGIVIPKGIRSLLRQIPGILQDAENCLSQVSRDHVRRSFRTNAPKASVTSRELVRENEPPQPHLTSGGQSHERQCPSQSAKVAADRGSRSSPAPHQRRLSVVADQ